MYVIQEVSRQSYFFNRPGDLAPEFCRTLILSIFHHFKISRVHGLDEVTLCVLRSWTITTRKVHYFIDLFMTFKFSIGQHFET